MSETPQNVSQWERQRTIWRDNHIGIILSVMGCILVAGATVLAYRQNRFEPPRFPDARSLQGAGRPAMVESVVGEIPISEALTVTVTGAANENGTMFLAIYADKASFNDPAKAISRTQQAIINGSSTFTFRAKDLPKKLAIAVYHDENLDSSLNRNAIGIPLERYGFSNDARGTLGPPSFEEAEIERPDSGSIQLFIR